jgi:hypothetical protein
MQSKHAKSPCCAARVRRFGPRRRQCVECGRTWTVRPKKRGRPVHRSSAALLHRVLVKGYTVGQLFSHRTAVALPAYRYRFRQALQRWVSRPSPQKIPPGPLVLLTDGLWFEFDAMRWVLYLVALKPCRGHQATFLDPLLLPGKEGASRWQRVVEAIPVDARTRIRAIVADNLPGIEKIARHHHWVLQLCHFHLLLKLQAPRRRVRYTLRGGAVREEIYQSIRNALLLPDGKRFAQTVEHLERLSWGDCGTLRIKTVLGQFLLDLPFYRSYLAHPELGLPLTTNAVESMCRLLREMLRSSRAGSNPKSLLLWVTALIRMRTTVTCNGHTINRIS